MTTDQMGNIRRSADISGDPSPHHRTMELRIVLDGVEPPCGVVRAVVDSDAARTPDADEVAFVGWLGLLRALAEVVARPSTAPPAGE